MKIGIDMGHSLKGASTGADGVLNEVAENRRIGNRLITMLREDGHTVVNCTVDSATSQSKQLGGIIKKANAQPLDLFVSIHLNAGGGHGTEIYTYKKGSTAEHYANKILTNVVASGNFTNRGVKTAQFYVLKKTVAPAVLLEVCFVDSQEDATKLNTEAVARAIFKGITGNDYFTSAPSPSPSGILPNGDIQKKAVVIANGGLNVRSNRDINSSILGALPYGTVIDLWYCLNGWCSIGYKGQTGFIYTKYVKLK